MTPLELDQGRFLGRRPFVPDSRDLLFSRYLDRPAAERLIDSGQVPAAHAWHTHPTPTGQRPAPDTDPLGNDGAGNCVYAGPGHHAKMIGQQTGDPIEVTADMAIAAYAEDTGYDPVTGANDNGQYIREMLKRWKAKGLYGTRLEVYALVDPSDPVEVAIASFAGCGLHGGYSLPLASQGQTDAMGRQLWDVPAGGWPAGMGPGTWGGHHVWSMAPSPGLEAGNSWGELTYMTPAWRVACCDELWLCLVDRWRMANGRAPNGFAWEDLLADAAARGG